MYSRYGENNDRYSKRRNTLKTDHPSGTHQTESLNWLQSRLAHSKAKI